MIAGSVGGESDDGRGGDPHEQRRGRDDGDLARAQTRPIEPDRQIGQLRAGDEKESREHGGDAGGKSAPRALGVILAHAEVRRLGAAPG